MKMNNQLLFGQKNTNAYRAKLDQQVSKKSADFVMLRKQRKFEEMVDELCMHMDVPVCEGRFIYFFDYDFRFDIAMRNLTPNYAKIVNYAIDDMYLNEPQDDYCRKHDAVLDAIKVLIERIYQLYPENDRRKEWIKCMLSRKAEGFEEALQRVLFLNQLLWQTGSNLVGLGRLDALLGDLYQNDVKNNNLSRDEARRILVDFMMLLHDNYWYKSGMFLGDTGQIVIVGGKNIDGSYFHNELTELFMEAAMICKLPEPKVLLRVSKKTPRKIMEGALRCMATGIGSPLLSNDEVIIPRLIEFGIEEEDAYNYCTSACWEPLIGGKSSAMNNQSSLVYVKAVNRVLQEEILSQLVTYEKFEKRFYHYLKLEVLACENKIYRQKFVRNSLLSIFLEGCDEKKKDAIVGGAKYHNVGMTTVSLGNAVNALLNIKRYVYDEQKYSLVDAKKMMLFGYEEYPDAKEVLKNNPQKYAKDGSEVIGLSNQIIRFVSEITKDFRTPMGGKLKFGVSSPNYLIDSTCEKGSFDGREQSDPFTVHISGDDTTAYTEVFNFAAALDYNENRFNGNVIDIIISPSFLEKNFDKMIALFMQAIEVGFFQLQTNVVSSETLEKAKENPEQYQQLVVRVWGFSAYFVDLPKEYQDLLIKRAKQNERMHV